MRTPEFWRRLSQVLPELLLDSSALGSNQRRTKTKSQTKYEDFFISFRFKRRFCTFLSKL